MACDLCQKISAELVPLSDYICKYLPYKYKGMQVCPPCERKLNDRLNMERALAWQRTALFLVDTYKAKHKGDK